MVPGLLFTSEHTPQYQLSEVAITLHFQLQSVCSDCYTALQRRHLEKDL